MPTYSASEDTHHRCCWLGGRVFVAFAVTLRSSESHEHGLLVPVGPVGFAERRPGPLLLQKAAITPVSADEAAAGETLSAEDSVVATDKFNSLAAHAPIEEMPPDAEIVDKSRMAASPPQSCHVLAGVCFLVRQTSFHSARVLSLCGVTAGRIATVLVRGNVLPSC